VVNEQHLAIEYAVLGGLICEFIKSRSKIKQATLIGSKSKQVFLDDSAALKGT
jgi:hypothetical protein